MANKNKLMEKAQKYLQKGKLKETIVTLNEVIKVDPTDFRVLLKKGELESRIGDNEAAKASYNQVAEQYSQDGFYLKAIAIYKKILKLDSEEFHIYSKLAYLYRKLGLDTEARKNLKVVAEYYKAKGLRTNYNEVAMQLTELGESVSDSQIAFVEKVAEEGDSENAVDQFRSMSKKYQDGGNVKQLDNIVKKMEELRIKDLECFHIQAQGYLNCNEPKKSLQVIQKAYGMDLQNTTTLELLGKCFIELKQPQKSISVFNELVKIYDRAGDMRNLNRIKNEISQAIEPQAASDSVPEFQENIKYDTINRDESDEFTIEEVQAQKPEPSKKIGAPAVSVEYQEIPHAESSISELGDGLDDAAADQLEIISSNDLNYDRTSAQPINEDSFMNVYVDAFDGSEDTVLAKPSDVKKTSSLKMDFDDETRIAKPPVAIEEELDFSTEGESEEIAFSFSEESFELTMDSDEATKIDVGPLAPEKSMESTADLLNMKLEDEIPEETVLEAPAQKQQMIGFDDFYSDNQKEKSEISVYEEEFVSISQFLDEASKPRGTPEKIEIHDQVLKSKPKESSASIKYGSLSSTSLSADVEPSMDFSTLDLSEIDLKIPGMEDSSISSKDLMNSLLDDVEPEETVAASSLADQIQLDEKTILDIKHEFKESAKVERAPIDESFFDLAGELRDEISEFEKSFGTMDEDAEEEFLSPEEVILEFKKGIARTIDKSDHQTHYNLGVAYKEMGLIDEAISAFELASNHPESRVDATSMIGICLADKNDYATAVKLYLQILPTINYQDPKYLGMMYQLGDAYMELRQHVDAYKAFSKVKDLDATFRDVKSRVKELGFNLGMSENRPTQQSGKMIVDMKDRKKNKF